MARRNGFLSAESSGDGGGRWTTKEIVEFVFLAVMSVLWVFTIPTGKPE